MYYYFIIIFINIISLAINLHYSNKLICKFCAICNTLAIVLSLYSLIQTQN